MDFLKKINSLYPKSGGKSRILEDLKEVFEMSYNLSVTKILQDNGYPINDADKELKIGKVMIQKDGYTDSLRLRELVAAKVPKVFAAGLMVPTLKGEINCLSFKEQWDLKELFDGKQVPKGQEVPIWGGNYETPAGDCYDDDDEIVTLPAYDYYNIKGRKAEIKAIVEVQAGEWTVVDDCTCEDRKKHSHALHAQYCYTAVIGAKQIALAPPIPTDSVGDLTVEGAAYVKTRNYVLTQKAAVDEVEEDKEDVVSEEEEDEVVFKTAGAAMDSVIAEPDLGRLKQIVRNAKNREWTCIDPLASSKTNKENIKKTLNATYMKISGKIINGNPSLSSVLEDIKGAAAKQSKKHPDNVMGWLMARLANDVTIEEDTEGKLFVQ